MKSHDWLNDSSQWLGRAPQKETKKQSEGAPPPAQPTWAPPAGPLLSGIHDQPMDVVGYRPKGTRDWLLIYTELGRGLFGRKGQQVMVSPGSLALLPAGTPHDYRPDPDAGRWRNLWVHFVPNPDWLDLLNWPEQPGGVRVCRPDDETADRVFSELMAMHRFACGSLRRRHDLAMNALHRALLLLDSTSTASGRYLDARIRLALEAVAENPSAAWTVSHLARKCELGRSRFMELFRDQVGMAPLQWLESFRLQRARLMLEMTEQPVAAIAEQVGFASPFYFSTRFRLHYGESPTAFRVRVRSAQVES